MPTNIIAIPALKDNYIWLIQCQQNAVVVDPGEAQPVLAALAKQNAHLKAILVTHHHWDHTGGIEPLLTHATVPVYAPQQENISHTSHALKDGDLLAADDTLLNFEVISVPGHTLGHIAYYTKDSGVLFCGDTLFSAGCGRLFEGTAQQMYDSLQRLVALPDTTKIYCTHEYTLSNLEFAQAVEPDNAMITQYQQQVACLRQQQQPSLPSTIRLEKMINPFLRCEYPSVKKSAEHYAGKTLKTLNEVFATLRQWKDEF